MFLIEEDSERVGEESGCGAYESLKENTNKQSNKNADEFNQPRALKGSNKGSHGIKISVMRDERVVNHLKQEPTEALNLMFYDWNNSS